MMMITKEQALEDLIRLEGDLGEDWEALERIRAYIGQSQPVPGAMKDPKNEDAEWARGYRTGWNSCRASMIAAALESGDDDA